MTRRKKTVLAAIGIVAAVGILLAVKFVKLRKIAEPRITAMLQEDFNSDVTYTAIHISPGWTFRVTVEGVVLKLRNRPEPQPLIRLKSMTIEGKVSDFLQMPAHIARVRMRGLEIHVPPRQPKTGNEQPKPAPGSSAIKVVVDEIDSADGSLELIPRNPQKLPLEFSIPEFQMRNFSMDQPSRFHAELTNPKPVGDIIADGDFGPWNREEPGDTAVSGQYSFEHVDMASIHGLGGTLSSTGKFSGQLDSINVSGKTETPDFQLTIAHNPMPLETDFTALVDGTTGDTYLQNVQAMLMKSPLNVKGAIVGQPGAKGRDIDVETSAEGARIQDFLRLAIKGNQPLMTGSTNLRAKIHIPPGEEDIVQKLRLDGSFGISGAHFTKETVQSKLDTLSRKGSGHPGDMEMGDVVSDLTGTFHMQDGVVTFSRLSFGVPGAGIALNGTYTMSSGALDFHGTLRLRAKLSQTTTGIKSALLMPFNSLFARKGAGTVLPIKITGTHEHPEFGLDFGNKKKDEKQGK